MSKTKDRLSANNHTQEAASIQVRRNVLFVLLGKSAESLFTIAISMTTIIMASTCFGSYIVSHSNFYLTDSETEV